MHANDQIISRIEKYFSLFILICFSAISLGLFLWELNCSQLFDYAFNNALTPTEQSQILQRIIISFLFIAPLSVGAIIKFPEWPIKIAVNILLKLVSCLFLMPLVLNKALWRSIPIIMIVVMSLLALYIFSTIRKIEIPSIPFLKNNTLIPTAATYTVLTLLILGYACYFSYYTILNHYNLGTQTLDFGFFQNAFVNTLHGHFMRNSYMNDAIVFRDHGDFILLLYLPFYYLFPRAETLLTVQSFSIALAALPLFFLCKKILKSNLTSLIIVIAFLLHPANHSANFYDIHQFSFLPLCVFCVFYFLEKNNLLAFIASMFFLLSIKMDMFVILILISCFTYSNDHKNLRLAAYCFSAGIFYGLLYFFVLSKWALYSHWFYYAGIMVDKSAGLGEILKTIITNPMFILKTILTQDRILYFCQLFGPLLFIPLIRKKNYILFIYGAAVTLLGWQALHEIYFQYVWLIIPFLFIGLIYVLNDLQMKNVNIYPLLITILFTSFVYSWQYGAVLNKKYFRGGFHEINFVFSPENKKRLDSLNDFIARIPTDASVCASEFLASHMGDHPNVKRFNDLSPEPSSSLPEYLLLFDPDQERPDLQEYLKSKKGYRIIGRREGFQLLTRPLFRK